MRPLVVLAWTVRGAALAHRLAGAFPGSRVVAPKGAGQPSGADVPAVIAEAAAEGAGLVFVGAAGIAVRLLAPYLRGKEVDPPVVVVDEEGHYAIPLLGGHRGGANELAGAVGDLLGAEVVVTTASDEHGLPALDLLGRGFGWTLRGGEVRALARALLDGEPIGLLQEAGEALADVDHVPLGQASRFTPYPSFERLEEALALKEVRGGLVVSDRRLPPLPDTVVLAPKTIAVGVGSVRGIAQEALAKALEDALAEAGFLRESVGVVATLAEKEDEPGIRALAEGLGVPLVGYPAEVLRKVAVPHPSEAVARAVGTPSVAEAAALLAAEGGELVLPKRARGGVTVALARRRDGLPLEFVHPGRGGKGALYVVGIGPGDPELLTVRARRRLREADVVVGLRRYVELVRPWLPEKVYLPSPIGSEEDRARRAIALAQAGLKVALISSGDAGMYGMAGVVFTELFLSGWQGDPPVEVVPGVTAMTAAAALLGAPLMHDVATVSLSDRLTPWETIEERLRSAVAAGFAVALYNPVGAHREAQFRRALEVLKGALGEEAAVGVVRRAFRAGQEAVVRRLGELSRDEVDMETILIVPPRSAFVRGNLLVTPRGYRREEDVRRIQEVGS